MHSHSGLSLQPGTWKADPLVLISVTKEMPASAEAEKITYLWYIFIAERAWVWHSDGSLAPVLLAPFAPLREPGCDAGSTGTWVD